MRGFPDLVTLAIDCPKPTRDRIWEPKGANSAVDEIATLSERHPRALMLLLGLSYGMYQTVGYRRGEPWPERAFGLIVVPCELATSPQRSVWRRIGICSRVIEHRLVTEDMKPFLLGKDSSWSHLDGILG